MKNKSILKLLVITTVTFGLMISCNNSNKKIKENQEITIGALAPLTGNYSRYGIAMKEGIDIAIEDFNSSSKIQLSVNYQDSKGNANAAINAFKFLTDVKDVKVILGPGLSGISQSVAPFAEKSKIVCISSVATADTLKYAGDYYFRNVPPNSYQAKTIASYLSNDLSVKKVGVFYENNAFGRNMDEIFNKFFEEAGGNISYSFSYDENQTDFTNVIDKAINNEVEYLFIPGTSKSLAMFIRQLRERNITLPIITGDGGYGEELNSIAGTAADGMICTLMAVEDTTSTKFKEFSAKYKVRYNKEPDVYALYSYDAARIIGDCISSLDSNFSSDQIKQCLYDKEFNGLAGAFDFDEYGEVDKPFLLFNYQDGEYTRIERK